MPKPNLFLFFSWIQYTIFTLSQHFKQPTSISPSYIHPKLLVKSYKIKLKINLIFSSYFRKFILVLLMQKIKKNSWSDQEVQLLTNLYSQFTSKKWKRISEQFRSRGFNRSEIECREKWINFLDPKINRKEWQEWQLRKLYEIHSQVGTRWCVVQKHIGRTQNKIKNHFYGTLRNFIRFVVSHFDGGRNCYNTEISHLPPSYLNSLYNSTDQFETFKSEAKNAIYAMTFKIDKLILMKRIEEEKSCYEKLNELFLKQIFKFRSAQNMDEIHRNEQNSEYKNLRSVITLENKSSPFDKMMPCPNMYQYPLPSWNMFPFPNFHPAMLWYP